MAGHLKSILSSENIEIVKWRYKGHSSTHENVRVSLSGVEWILDRNYGQGYLTMPVTQETFLRAYHGKIEEVRK